MKIHRFISEFNLSNPELKISDRELVNQIGSVLRLKKGERILLCDGKLNEALSTIMNVAKDFVKVKINSVVKNTNESGIATVLYCSILKKEHFELVVQKATEVGIKEIVPVITKRTVKLNLNHQRLEKIMKEAAEQSGRGIVPLLHKPIDFDQALVQAKNKTNLFFNSSGGFLNPKSYILNPIGVWVGPEGGWDANEIELAKNNRFDIVSLGKLTLRAETAAIIASYLASNGG